MTTIPRTRRAALTAVALAFASGMVAGCYDPIGPEDRLEIGTAWFYFQPAVVDIPDTVDAGVPFDVMVRTFGGGCDRIGPTEVARGATEAVVVPMDYTLVGPNLACPDILRSFDHETTVTFANPGEGRVVIRALREPEDTVETLTRTVWVR